MDWPWKITSKWPIGRPNLSTGSKDTVIFILKSADLYSHSWFDLTIKLALKNYPEMTLWKSKSVHRIKRNSDIYFDVSWFVQSQLIWSNYWTGKTNPKWPFKCPNQSTGSKFIDVLFIGFISHLLGLLVLFHPCERLFLLRIK